jgi:hypothetical protein
MKRFLTILLVALTLIPFCFISHNFIEKVQADEPQPIHIRTIAEDSRGMKWYATDEGLYRYDGTNWIKFTVENSGLISNMVNDVSVDNDDRVWCATDSGLVVYDNVTWEKHTAETGGPSFLSITDVVVDAKGMVWATNCAPPSFGMSYDITGLYRYDGTEWTQEYRGCSILNLTVSPEKTVWVGSIPTMGNVQWFSVAHRTDTHWEAYMICSTDYIRKCDISFDETGMLHVVGDITSYFNVSFDGFRWTRLDIPGLIPPEEFSPSPSLYSPWFPLKPGNSWTYQRYIEQNPVDLITFPIIGTRQINGVWHAVFLDGREFWVDENGSISFLVPGMQQSDFDLSYVSDICEEIDHHIFDYWYTRYCFTKTVPAGTFYGLYFSWGEVCAGGPNYFFVENVGITSFTFWTDYSSIHEYKLIDANINGHPLAVNDTSEPVSGIIIESPFPNPFSLQTTIRYTLPLESKVELTIYDILGRKINVLVNDTVQPGVHDVIWDGKGSDGISVGSGIYLYKFKADNFNGEGKLLLMK